MSERRAALPGELCTCGRQAVFVDEGGELTATGDCGQRDGGLPVDGVCTFCGDTVDHAAYWTAEREAGRPAASPSEAPQGGRCPLYRLRLADPLPEVHPESVQRYDHATDLRARSEGRLRGELVALFEDLGADFAADYQLTLPGEDDEPETGDLEDVILDIVWATRQALGGAEDGTTAKPEAGQGAVVALRPRLDELGMSPNPLAGVDDAHALLEAAGGMEAWGETAACDRPLLILRRVVRRAVTPEAPWAIYRGWWT